LSRLVIVCVNQ